MTAPSQDDHPLYAKPKPPAEPPANPPPKRRRPLTAPSQDEHPLYAKPKPPAEPPANPPPKRRRPPADRPYLTWLLMAVNILIFLWGYLVPGAELKLFVAGSLYPPAVVLGGEVHRLFTAMFLHASLAHILFNMYALYILGSQLEPLFGRLRFGLIYLLGGLTSSALSLALGDYDSPSVGASGAVFAIFAAQALHLYQHRHLYLNAQAQLRHIAFLLGINLFIGFLPGSRIDMWAHLGGMLGGLALAWQIAPRLLRPPATVGDACDVIVRMENGVLYTAPFVTLPYLHRQMALNPMAVKTISETPPLRCVALGSTPHIIVEKLARSVIEDTIDSLVAQGIFESLFTRVTEAEAAGSQRRTGGGKPATREVKIAIPNFRPTSVSDLAKLDVNPLSRHLPALTLYCLGLVAVVALSIGWLGA